MKNLLIAAFVAFAVASCEKKSEQSVQTSTTPPDSMTVPETHEPVEPSTLQSCYVGNTGKDSVFISLDDNLGTITGKLRYKNFEKDSSMGDVMGIKSGDTLKLTYSFESEGISSERDIYFLQKNGELIEGIGDHKTEGNKEFYVNPAKLKYETAGLKSADCIDFEKKFASK